MPASSGRRILTTVNQSNNPVLEVGYSRYKFDVIEIDIGEDTFKYISADVPVQILNRYYGYKPYIKVVNDLPSEIKEKDTVTRRLKAVFIDSLDIIETDAQQMASYWRMFIARNLNYKGKIIRYYRRVGNADIELRFVGKIENITIDNKGTTTIEAIDLMKALSKLDYPFISGITLSEDMPGIFPVSSQAEMLALSEAIEGDYALRTDFVSIPFLQLTALDGVGTLPNGTGVYYYFAFVAYNVDEPIAKSLVSIGLPDFPITYDAIRFHFLSPANTTRIKIFGYTTDYLFEIVDQATVAETFDEFIWDSIGSYPASNVPADGERYFILTDPDFTNIANWDYVPDPDFVAEVEGDISLLDDSGYLQVDEEIFYFDGILTDSEGYTLINVERALFGTESPRHFAGSVLYFIIAQVDPIDIFEMAKLILLYGGIDEVYIHPVFDEYAALNILDVTCQPIIKKTKLSVIFFDLINLADAMSFQNEDGLIEALLHSDVPDELELLTDESNIIYNSSALDLNEESRKSRWVLYWNRFNLDEDLDSSDAYGRGNITIDGDAEDFYDDVETDVQYSAFLNAESELEITNAITYANTLLLSRKDRTNFAQWKLTASLEMKDDSLRLGQVVNINTKNVLSDEGVRENNRYRIIRKEPQGNKIKFNFLRMANPPFHPLTYDAENLIGYYDGDLDLDTSTWGDQSENGYDITWNNVPTVTPAAVNGHQIVTCNGTNENGFNNTIAITRAYTLYIVVREITKVGGDCIFQAGLTGLNQLRRSVTPPNPLIFVPESGTAVTSSPDLVTGDWTVITQQVSGVGCSIKINTNAASANTGTNLSDKTGMIISAQYNPPSTGFINASYAFKILRSGIDTEAEQELFINWLMERFAIT